MNDRKASGTGVEGSVSFAQEAFARDKAHAEEKVALLFEIERLKAEIARLEARLRDE